MRCCLLNKCNDLYIMHIYIYCMFLSAAVKGVSEIAVITLYSHVRFFQQEKLIYLKYKNSFSKKWQNVKQMGVLIDLQKI